MVLTHRMNENRCVEAITRLWWTLAELELNSDSNWRIADTGVRMMFVLFSDPEETYKLLAAIMGSHDLS